jgi:diguanylate cyclase (GGDEF)-like protein
VAGERILIVDDDPDILDVLKITLEGEQYEVIEARDGQEALKLVRANSPSLVILDYMMPKMNGLQVCQILKKDILLRHLPIIMLTGKGELSDKVEGIDAGADDYIVKPFEPVELLARVKMILRRTTRDLDANPLTRLPGNISILAEIESRIERKELFAVCYLDLDKFKSYNDKYGFEHGDEVIRQTARILIRTMQEIGNPDDFIGHIGGDDFVFITTPQKVDKFCQKIIKDFDTSAPNFYNEDDRKRGYIIGKDRQGNVYKITLLTISIGVVTNETRKIIHVAEVGEIGAELKSYAKSFEGSNYVKDKRRPS